MPERHRIMIVDDDEVSLSMLRRLLSNYGFELATAKSGEECLAGIKTFNPDLVLLDIMMPGLDGFETCKKMKRDPEFGDIPVIFVTSLAARDNIMKGFMVGASDYIMKPYDRSEVIARARSVLFTQSLLRDKSNLIRMNHALINRVKKVLEEVSLPTAIEDVKGELTTVTDSILDRLDALRKGFEQATGVLNQLAAVVQREGEVSELRTEMSDVLGTVNTMVEDLKTGIGTADTMLNNVVKSFQFADRVSQQMNEIGKVIRQLHHIMQGGEEDGLPMDSTSTKTVLSKKVKQEEIDSLLSSLDLD